MKLEYAKTPIWANAANTLINLTIKWEDVNEEYPFTASADDSEQHGQDIFKNCVAGEFGAIADYIPPENITGEDALLLVRTDRDNLLTTEVDPIITNPLRWAEMSTAEQEAWAAYRRALLDITDTYPNPSYVWGLVIEDYVLTNCIFPVKQEFIK
tara:strand:+ start:661 stop:1125 length:465 start_codon:yes stop_codon:yes gene_type:complete